MNILAILVDRLRAVERLYDGAAGVFLERKSRIEAEEEPYEPPPFNPDTDAMERPFLKEWIEADEFQNIIGQACISVVHSCLKDYLDGVLKRSGIKPQARKFVSQRRNVVKGKGWFGQYLALFAEAYSIDWAQSPVPIDAIEEINLVRNDIHHGRPGPRLNRYQDRKYTQRFPSNLFIDDYQRSLPVEHRLHGYTQIYVSPDAFKESIRKVESFCRFVETRTNGSGR